MKFWKYALILIMVVLLYPFGRAEIQNVHLESQGVVEEMGINGLGGTNLIIDNIAYSFSYHVGTREELLGVNAKVYSVDYHRRIGTLFKVKIVMRSVYICFPDSSEQCFSYY